MNLKEAIAKLTEDNKIRRKGRIYPFFYIHIFKKLDGKSIGVCNDKGQVKFIKPTFDLEDIYSNDWEVIED